MERMKQIQREREREIPTEMGADTQKSTEKEKGKEKQSPPQFLCSVPWEGRPAQQLEPHSNWEALNGEKSKVAPRPPTRSGSLPEGGKRQSAGAGKHP